MKTQTDCDGSLIISMKVDGGKQSLLQGFPYVDHLAWCFVFFVYIPGNGIRMVF
jgi:hypothetical protein